MHQIHKFILFSLCSATEILYWNGNTIIYRHILAQENREISQILDENSLLFPINQDHFSLRDNRCDCPPGFKVLLKTHFDYSLSNKLVNVFKRLNLSVGYLVTVWNTQRSFSGLPTMHFFSFAVVLRLSRTTQALKNYHNEHSMTTRSSKSCFKFDQRPLIKYTQSFLRIKSDIFCTYTAKFLMKSPCCDWTVNGWWLFFHILVALVEGYKTVYMCATLIPT